MFSVATQKSHFCYMIMYYVFYFPYRYLYTEQIKVKPEQTFDMLLMSKRFMIKTLTARCRHLIKKSITCNNVCKILEKSLIAEEKSLISSCLGLITRQTRNVLKSKEFVSLTKKTLVIILKLEELSANEVDVFWACYHWATAECDRRHMAPTSKNQRSVLGDALFLIRFPTMSLSQFAGYVVGTGILTDEETLKMYKYMTCKNKPKIPFLTTKRKIGNK